MDQSIEVEIVSSCTPISNKRKNSDRDDDSPPKVEGKKFCDVEDHQEILTQIALLTSSFLDFKTTVLTKLNTIEEDLQLVRANTLVQAEPVDTDAKLQSLTQSVEEIKESLRRAPINVNQENGTNNPVPPPSRPVVTSNFARHHDLNKRKMCYYNHIQHEDRYEILGAQAADDPPGVPAKFLPVRIINEPQEDLEARKELCNAKIKCELTRLKNASQRYKKQYQDIDAKVISEIENDINSDEQEKIRQKEEWTKKTAEEENRSKELWRPKHDNIVRAPDDAINTGKIYLFEGTKYATSSSTRQDNPNRTHGNRDYRESQDRNDQQINDNTNNSNFLWQRPRYHRRRHWQWRRTNRTGRPE